MTRAGSGRKGAAVGKPRAKPSSSALGRLAGRLPLGRGDLGQSLLLILPLLIVYDVFVIFATRENGVDFVTRLMWSAVGHDRGRYLIVQLVLAVGFGLMVWYLRQSRAFSFRVIPPLLLEAAIYALTLGSVIIFVMDRVTRALAIPNLQLGHTGEEIIMAMGAGVHEELVFRLGLMVGLAWALGKLGLHRGVAIFLAMVLSSVVFSAVHHLGALGDPFSWSVFVYRALAGLSFALIFYYRSLAHAVYAHFFYDFYVMVIRS